MFKLSHKIPSFPAVHLAWIQVLYQRTQQSVRRACPQIMMKLRAAKNLDARQAMLLEHAYFQVLPLFLLQPLLTPVAEIVDDSLEKSAAAVHYDDSMLYNAGQRSCLSITLAGACTQVRPPERAALTRKLRPPLQAFIRHLLRDVLTQDTLQTVRISGKPSQLCCPKAPGPIHRLASQESHSAQPGSRWRGA